MQTKHRTSAYQYLDIITAIFVAVLLISNVASTKITSMGFLHLDAGTILFPISYIIGDILTEVYGFSRARRVIWIGFFCNILMALTLMFVTVIPASADWPHQQAFETILGLAPRIVFASVIAYIAGEFINSFILAKMKLATKGKYLWMRTLSSSLAGHFFDTVLFIILAFWGILSTEIIISLIVSNYLFKLTMEILFTPITYGIVTKLKKVENEDFYDKKTNFNPFVLQVENK